MAGAVMPLIAQTFVESRSNTTFDIIATSSNNDTNGAPLQRFQRRQVVNSPSLTSSEKVKRIGQRQSPRNNKDSPKGKAKDDEVYYWSDAKLTETFKVSFHSLVCYLSGKADFFAFHATLPFFAFPSSVPLSDDRYYSS